MDGTLFKTRFHIEKIRNIVGDGEVSAYQISTLQGDPVGRIGAVVDPAGINPANEGQAGGAEASAAETEHRSWFARLLAALRS